jgi:hypothetical protein
LSEPPRTLREVVRTIEVDDATYEFIAFAARTMGVSEAAIVERAVATLRAPSPLPEATRATGPAIDRWADRAIHADYRGARVTARFLPATRRVTLTSEPLAGKAFGSPSAAATAVVAALNAGREMTRVNGLRFWKDDATGARLDALVEPRPGAGRDDDEPR